MKYLSKILTIVLILIALPLAIDLFAFDFFWYEKVFFKYEIYQDNNYNQISEQTTNLLAYLQDKNNLNEKYYNSKELVHLYDVKNLYKLSKTIFILGILYAAVFAAYLALKNKIGKLLNFFYKSFFYTFIFYLVSGVFIYGFFEKAFYYFHILAFRNDYWLLDPKTDNLINIFTGEVFAELIFRIWFNVALFSFLLFLTFYFLTFAYKNKKTQK